MNAASKPARLFHMVAAAIAIFAMLPLTSTGAAAQGATAQGAATITVSSLTGDGSAPLPFVRFTVTDDTSGTVYGPLEAPPGTAQVTFSVDITDEAGTFTVAEETPPACGIAPDPLVVGPLEDGADTPVEFQTNFEQGCDQGALSAYKYVCPNAFDSSATDYAAWRDGCTQTQDGVSFIFTPDGGSPFEAVTGAYGISGRAPYVGLNPGDYSIQEAGATVAPTVFCMTYSSPDPATNPGYDSVEQVDVQNGTVSVSLNGGRIACDFFEAAAPGDDDATATADTGDDDVVQPAAETGSIELHKAQCPAGYEPNDNIFNDCHGDGLEDIEFTIDGPNGYEDSTSTVIEQTPGPGIVRFTDLEAGTYNVNEDIPGEANDIYVYCSLAEADDQVEFTYNDTGGIALPLGEDVQVICDWYNIPINESGLGSIDITKYTCDPGYEPSGKTYNDFLNDCGNPTRDVEFTVAPEGGGDSFTEVTNGNGEASFPGLQPANYKVSEDRDDDLYSVPYVYCTVNGGDLFRADTTNGNAWFLIDDQGQAVDCAWFNLPYDLSDPGQLTITKYLCPPGQATNFGDNCDEVLQDVTFELTGPSGYDQSDSTNGAGKVAFNDLDIGNYTITEIPPGDPRVSVYVVGCTENGNSFPFSYDDSTGLRANLKIGAGDDVRCTWYNVPPAPPKPSAPGSITVIKYLCQGKSNNAYDWQNDCTIYKDGADFDLLTAGGDTLESGRTDSSGKLVFDGLENGAYGLDETSGDWCRAEADFVDASGGVLVKNGGNTDVLIYNCNVKPVSVLPTTGAGAAAIDSAGQSGFAALAGGVIGVLILFGLRRRVLVPAVIRR